MSLMPCQVATSLLEEDPALTVRMLKVFGNPDDPIHKVEERAAKVLRAFRTIVWEADAQTLRFTYVSASAEDVLGYPLRRWLDDPSFWADTVLHRDDRSDALTFTTREVAQNRGYDLRYRAQTIDGRFVTLLDVARVTVGVRGVAERVRGVMVEVQPDGPGQMMLSSAMGKERVRRPIA